MSSVVDPLLSTVTLDLLRPKETLGNPEEHFRKVRIYSILWDLAEYCLRDVCSMLLAKAVVVSFIPRWNL